MEEAVGREEGKHGERKRDIRKGYDFKSAKQWRIQLSSQQRAPLVL